MNLRSRKTILAFVFAILLLQVFPVQGISYLLGGSITQSELSSKLFCDNSDEEDADGEDSLKIKKQEYLHDANAEINQHSQELLLRYPVKLKIGQILDHFCKILIPPPNTAI